MGGVISRLIALWQRLHVGRPSLAEVRYVASPADVPDRLSRRELVVVGTDAFPKWAVFNCPCGRGHRIMLSLQRSHLPHWRLELGGHGPSLWPSVHSVTAYRCHFWLRDGRVRWVRSWPWREQSGPNEERETASAA